MKCQTLVSEKNKKRYLKMSAENLPSILSLEINIDGMDAVCLMSSRHCETVTSKEFFMISRLCC